MSTSTLPDADYSWIYNGHTYGLYKQATSWSEANVIAADAGGYLAKIDSAEENQTIFTEVVSALSTSDFNTSFAPHGGNAAYIWLGATDAQSEGDWQWDVDETALSSTIELWGEGALGSEPDNYNSNQHYLALGLENWPLGSADDEGYGNAGSWNDLDGGNTLYFVVEKDTVVNSPPTGSVTITGTATQGERLTASNDLSDQDGIGYVRYQWQADGVDIPYRTSSTLLLGQEHVGKTISVVASYQDDAGNNESVSSAATDVVANVNDLPSGEIVIAGSAYEGYELTVDTSSVFDLDGIGTYSYQWYRDRFAIEGATDNSYTLTNEDIGSLFRVEASYTDNYGTFVSLYSAATSKVLRAPYVGDEFQVNTYTYYDQSAPSVASTSDGGFVVTWTSSGQDGSYGGVYGQRYDSDGNTLGDEFQVNTYTDDGQSAPSVASTSDGGFVVTWHSDDQDGSSYGVYGQRYDSDGNTLGDEFQVNTYTDNSQSFPSVASTSDGGFVVTWDSSGQDGSYGGVYGQRYDSDGNTLGDEFQVNTFINSYQTSVASTPDGGFVVTWQSSGQDGSGSGIYGQRYDSVGNTLGDEFQVNTFINSYQTYPSVASTSDGGFVVTWESDDQDGSSYGVYGQRYDSDGNTLGDEFQVNTYTDDNQWFPSVASTSDGGFVVTWESYGQDGSGSGIYGQRYDSDGNTLGDEFQVNTFINSYQTYPSVASTSDGGFVVTWSSYGQDGSEYGIYGQRFSAFESDSTTNSPPTGIVSITGSTVEGETLTADTTDIADPDGLSQFSYKWYGSSDSGSNWNFIAAGESSLLLTEDTIGQQIKVVISYTDGQGTEESVESTVTSAVTADTTSNTNITVTASQWASSAALSGVELQTGTTTDSNGEADLAIDTATTITPSLATDSSADGAVNLQDAILILKQIVGLETFNDYQTVASDFDQDGSTGLNDAIGVLKHVVGLDAPEPEWVFMEEGATEPLVDSSLEITSDSGDVALIGVLTGDVDGSWEAAA